MSATTVVVVGGFSVGAFGFSGEGASGALELGDEASTLVSVLASSFIVALGGAGAAGGAASVSVSEHLSRWHFDRLTLVNCLVRHCVEQIESVVTSKRVLFLVGGTVVLGSRLANIRKNGPAMKIGGSNKVWYDEGYYLRDVRCARDMTGAR